MDKEQATTIIVLLAAILFVLLVGRTAAVELFDNLVWVAVAILLVVVAALIVRQTFRTFRGWQQKRLESKIEQLRAEIATYPGPRLTTANIPQRFPSKDAAQAFGERWSRGGPDSFCAKAIDVHGWIEYQPSFDKTSISEGILFSTPALFFGMREAHRDDDAWWLDFLRAEKQWLRDYRDHLRKNKRL
jgi:ABC-type nickel/cobalt efflux system permease component RcnA